MKLTKATKNLLIDLEEIIGDEAYNPRSYNGYTDEEGCAFRYPVKVPILSDNELFRVRSKSEFQMLFESKHITLEQLLRMRYVFGANELWIGYGIINLLTELEKRYGIDIEQLEKDYQKKQKSKKTT